MVELWQDMRGYFDVHHSASDTLETIDAAALAQVAAAVTMVAYAASQADAAYGRISPEKRAPQ